MNKYFLLFLLLFGSINLRGEANLSPLAQDLYRKLSSVNPDSKIPQDIINRIKQEYPLKSLNNYQKDANQIQSADQELFVSAIIKTNKDFSSERVQENGTKLVKISNSIYTAQIPLESYLKFIKEEGIVYLQADGFAEQHLDSALIVANINQVKKGTNNLPQSYSGKGVIIGIIDWGFDYTHPAFYDSVNHKCRISRVWDQSATGTPPSPFSFGVEYASAEEIQGAKTDYTESSHGSHVAGIAAGDGWFTNGKYEGIATDAEIVMVAVRHPRPEFTGYTNAFSDFIDAAKYIFDYAESVGKPVVVNLSWGNVMGPKDGKSIVSDALESMVGKGKIFVGSAGNSGKNNVHCSFACNPVDSVFKTYFTYANNIMFTPKEIFVDIWGEDGKQFEVNLSALKSSTALETIVQTGFFNISKDTVLTFTLPYSPTDTITVIAFLKPKEYDTRPRILLNIKSKNFIWFKIEGKSQNSEIHLFSSLLKNGTGYTSYFTDLKDSSAITGNSDYTICDWFSSDRILCIGASVSKEGFTNTKNQNFKMSQGASGNRAAFSSIGPTLDKRTKPDLAAPGSVLVSSVNSYDKNYGGLSSSSDMVVRINFNNRTYTYSAYQGTSMSSPVVTGSVALLLGAKPDLTPEEVIELLKTTAIVDSSTTDTIPDFYWGSGKLNTLGAMGKLLGINSIEVKNETLQTHPLIYPNPASSFIEIRTENKFSDFFEYRIYDNAGKEIYFVQNLLNTGNYKVDIQKLQNGTYFIKFNGKQKSLTKKFIIYR